ncbi:hypothetical protein PENANT_c018G05250 [Penicillium antarcticum]|uniref:FAD-binding PCMH-type domain-containing protein n=1 Tax=Penicillium antarcticum TaxID=416450 RepID=A0A1V6Q1C4_9EURO|nr:uncharacterized protein N7508_003924 [Penicillium antarcticum]KAJ5313094.1 hypothetical protein N7508_003924 [Penicillium antarcticum]OQD83088.1 hypothetical protein PENANT_c018G05250 [Penicillium antarcticum]
MDELTNFLAQTPRIHYATPSSPDYDTLRPGYVLDHAKIPAMIVRPRSADDVAALVTVLKANGLPFSVRVGGHDMFGRSQVHEAITIDLREIAYVHVDPETHTARLGGGVLFMEVLKELKQHGMVVPHPVIPGVGFVGWATHGGYGLLSAQYGFGVDQILQARLVDSQAMIRDADEDMLTAIRGGGGSLGIIVELTIKVYPLAQVLAGVITYESSDISTTITRYNDAWRQQKEGIPSSLSLFQCIGNTPTGKRFSVLFVWASTDIESGKIWLSKVSSWTPVAVSTVAPTDMMAFNEGAQRICHAHAYGLCLTLNLRQLTAEIVAVISKFAALKPSDPSTMFAIHELRACTPQPIRKNVWDTRSPHFVVEILPTVLDADRLNEALEWAHNFYDEMMGTKSSNILPSTYLPLTEPKKVDMKTMYGNKYETLERIKQEYDPDNVFKHTLVQF